MRVWWLRLRLVLPWFVFRWLLPRQEPARSMQLLDWRYRHGRGRDDLVQLRPAAPVRPYWDRLPSVPQHMCRPELDECPCFDQFVSGDLTVRHTGG